MVRLWEKLQVNSDIMVGFTSVNLAADVAVVLPFGMWMYCAEFGALLAP